MARVSRSSGSTGRPTSERRAPPAAAPEYTFTVDPPPFRLLRVYAFDPSIGLQLERARLNEITLQVPWETADTRAASGVAPLSADDPLRPGPIGEYLEVIDYDPASDAFYLPVDLNDPHLLAQNGLPPSEGLPQFHQQMVYAVAMLTIRNFEQALGRVALWSPRRVRSANGRVLRDEFVRRLRIHPHALREANAYYSPEKKALLFGYFPAVAAPRGAVLGGGIVFTCLSHDIVTHETTHALLDGMHGRFIEPSNPDVLAFHEAFADIVALFQHFAHPDIVVDEIRRGRGDLRRTGSLLGQLAQQFGQAIGRYGALRDALGGHDDEGIWRPAEPDPLALATTLEPHARGAILVAAVFDAFLMIYNNRTADLIRIATGGTGVLDEGDIHPDLAARLAIEASKAAKHVMHMCIRALDYCPPVDLTFGDYLRALITADYDLVRDDDRGYRIALIEAFRRRGIYPHDIRSLSVESVRWQPPGPDEEREFARVLDRLLASLDAAGLLYAYSEAWDLSVSRQQVWEEGEKARATLHGMLADEMSPALRGFLGLDDGSFEVHALRPARRIGPDGQYLLELVVEITQSRRVSLFSAGDQTADDDAIGSRRRGEKFRFRGGATLLIDQTGRRVRYCISKRMDAAERVERQRRFLRGDADGSLAAIYFGRAGGADQEPFAALHRSQDELAEELGRRRTRTRAHAHLRRPAPEDRP